MTGGGEAWAAGARWVGCLQRCKKMRWGTSDGARLRASTGDGSRVRDGGRRECSDSNAKRYGALLVVSSLVLGWRELAKYKSTMRRRARVLRCPLMPRP